MRSPWKVYKSHFGLNIRSLQQWQRKYRFEDGTTTITEISQKHKTIAQTKDERGKDQNSKRKNEDEYIWNLFNYVTVAKLNFSPTHKGQLYQYQRIMFKIKTKQYV